MANNAATYVKNYQQNTKGTVDKIFDDLEKFQQFCVDFGHNYNPKNLYQENNHVYKDFVKYNKGREPRNRWVEDAKKFANENE